MNVVLRLMDLMLSLCGGVVGWWGGGGHFHVQPNYSVEVVLRCVVVGVETKMKERQTSFWIDCQPQHKPRLYLD